MRIVFADTHAHSNPLKGMGSGAIAERFRESGGWFVALVSLPPTSLGLLPSLEGFEKSLELLVSECRRAREKGLKVACLGGFHPAMIDKMVEDLGMDSFEAYNTSVKAIEVALKHAASGSLDGIAEIGRPHYRVKPHYVVISDLVLDYAVERARDLDLVVHLHLEEGGWATVADVDRRIRRSGAARDRVVMHHSKPGLAEHAVKSGIAFTIPAIYDVLKRSSMIEGIRSALYTLESDYIDDPSRPGRVLYPWEVAKNTERCVREGVIGEDEAARIHIDNVVKIYRVEPP